MPRPIRHVAHTNSPSKLQLNDDQGEKLQRKQDGTMQSPVRKMGRNAQRRPRDSDASSILTDDELSSPGTPYAQTPDSRPKNVKQGKAAAVATKHNLQKQAMHNRRSISGTHTPRQVPLRNEDSVPSNLQVVGTSLTPASKKPIPILSNFEDWLKLATDNKINATNSWNFALIDYFHEMSLLKDEGGKSINFQKASCTLDGCVKIYSSRVESVGVEAGRLLSGLATSATDEDGKKKKRRGEDGKDEEGSDVDGDESDGEGGKKKKEKKRKQRSHEATLAPSFASLQLKKLELEFAVDPLFKKASADFDEGGAKGLLLNHLCINEEGRIVFDSSDDAGDAKSEAKEQGDDTPETGQDHAEAGEQSETEKDASQSQYQGQQQQHDSGDIEIDLTSLANKFFPDLSLLDQLDICPSMKNFKLGDPTAALSIPLLNADNNDWKTKNPSPEKRAPPPPHLDGELNFADQSGLFLDGSHGLDFDNDDEDAIGLGGFDMNMDDQAVGFGQGGEAWAREAAVEPMLRPINAADDDEQQEGDDGYAAKMEHHFQEDAEQENMLAFFGKAVNSRAKVGTKAFQTLTNWRIAKIQQAAAAENAPPQRTRKEKEPFKIDFHGPVSENLKKLLAEKPVSNDKISLPRTQLKTKGRNLLDKDDELIDVKSMMRLWTKPKCRVSRNRHVIDEGFGARGRSEAPRIGLEDKHDEDEEDAPQGDYDANFFADDEPLGLPFDGPLPIDDDDDDDGGEQPGFVDAREMLSPPPDGVPATQNITDVLEGSQDPPDSQQPTASQAEMNMLPGSFGSQLVTQQGRRLRPEYVNYARTAKKVDVRALKENMWKGMIPRLSVFSAPDERVPTPPLTDADGDSEMMDADTPTTPTAEEQPQPQQRPHGKADEVLKFTDILSGLKSVYPDNQMKDISTSYGFICLLHLANEKGLVLEGGREEGTMEEILVRRDDAVGEGYVGE
ncbi:hypothetical protein LTR70_005444 [Exophiala xenobiotica]|uniref:Condensin complex subunit 2 n=1 Tax=Lithohypha guttulata TaxID=1690604 RepID=A0ABR0KBD1_9EURO|nr:hypothetical protein LTR24_005186 [Lithohypha guttulata]KAK5318422.1 hypothetical protein LTR70_005444 [Exophiala xenobiotica]